MVQHPYKLFHPKQQSSCALFASPHGNCNYPDEFLSRSALDERTIRSSEDAFVDQLYDSAPKFGAQFLKAGVPRAYVDLNRAHDELDPAVIENVAHTRHNPRVASGLGVIPRVVANGRAIYRGKLSLEEAEQRIRSYWFPYHKVLEMQLCALKARFGHAILFDCHSMPHDSLAHLSDKPQVVLGDRFGASAAPVIVEQTEAAFIAAGFRVRRNQPFSGAYIVQHYGQPRHNIHAIQIEIDRSLYMDEKNLEPNAQFDDIRARLQQVIAELSRIGKDGTMPQAAE